MEELAKGREDAAQWEFASAHEYRNRYLLGIAKLLAPRRQN